jgi:O-antigen/teichoic acid export membrane protein
MGIVIKKTISTAIINYLGVVLGIVNVLWLQTAIITKLQIGILSYIFDATILLFPFILFGTSGLPARFIHIFKNRADRNSFITLLFLVPFVVLTIVTIVFLIFKEPILSFLGKDVVKYQEYLVYVLPLLFCYIYQYLIEAILSTKSLTVFTSFMKNIYRRLIFIGLLICYSFNLISFFHLIYWFVGAHFIEIIILFFFFRAKHEFKFSTPKLVVTKAQRKEIISFAIYLIIGVSGIVMVGKIDSIMISGITDDLELLGIYAIAFYIATFIELPKRIVHQLVYPIMSKMVTEKKTEELKDMYRQTGINMSIIGIFLFLIVWYNIDELFLIIPNGELYSAGKMVVFYVGLAKVIDVIFGSSDLMINATKHYKWNGVLIPFLILATLSTNYYFIQREGIIGAAIATSLTIFIYSMAKFILVIAKLKMNLISQKHLPIAINLIAVIVLFYFKPRILDNNVLEIALNSILITAVFIGGNFLMKSSTEMNELISTRFKKIFGKS